MKSSLLASKIALRYLFSKKSHGAVNIISIVSICGVAVATMAIVCVLSVFNGFQTLLADKANTLSADIQLSASHGKVIENSDSLISIIESFDDVESVMPQIQDNALALYGNRQMPITLVGVDESKYIYQTAIQQLIKPDGTYLLKEELSENHQSENSELLSNNNIESIALDDFDENALFSSAEELYTDDETTEPQFYALLSVGTAIRLNARPNNESSFYLLTPRRKGSVNLSNPATAFLMDSVFVSGVFQSDQSDYDSNYVIIDIDLARRLFQYYGESTFINIKLKPSTNPSSVAEKIRQTLGDNIVVKDRMQQQEVNYQMVNIEKWISFLLLAFILVIASFNIISSLSMLIIDKEDNISTIYNIGGSKKFIGNVFAWESLYVNIIGAVGGIVIGLILCLLQEHFGLIKLNGNEANLIISAYPIKVEFSDILIILIPISIIALLSSTIASRFAKSRVKGQVQ